MKLLLLLASAPLFAAGPSGFLVWPPADLKAYEKTLHAKLDQNHSANERLPDLEGHTVLVVHREGTGLAETHEMAADFIYVISGEASVVVGGTMVDGKTTGPGEIRGASVNGGETKKAAAGDILHIPPKAPHWFKVDPGKQITYLVVKLESK
jgi:mannose-6-phosphate isomerase-like protein (cupin superfamily)